MVLSCKKQERVRESRGSECSDQMLFGSRARLQVPAYPFHVAKDAQQVPAEDFLDVVGTIAAVEQGLGDFGEVGGGVDTGWRGAAHTIEIGTKADVIDTGDFRD